MRLLVRAHIELELELELFSRRSILQVRSAAVSAIQAKLRGDQNKTFRKNPEGLQLYDCTRDPAKTVTCTKKRFTVKTRSWRM